VPAKQRVNLVIGLLFTILSLAVWMVIPREVAESWDPFGVDARFFPRLATVVMGIFGLVLALQSLLLQRRAPTSPAGPLTWAERPAPLLGTFFFIVAFVVLLPLLGFLLSATVVTTIYMLYTGIRPWWKAVAIAALTSLTVHYAFAVFLHVLLPRGSLFQ
jgi:cell division protein FtsW (lipid II flippase)